MTRRLIAYVHIGGAAYGPGDEVPPKVADRIGEHAWVDAADVEDVDDQDVDDQGDGAPESGAPPRSGRGSGIDAWRKFAEDNSVQYDTHASREEIIAAAEAAGVIEPEQPKE